MSFVVVVSVCAIARFNVKADRQSASERDVATRGTLNDAQADPTVRRASRREWPRARYSRTSCGEGSMNGTSHTAVGLMTGPSPSIASTAVGFLGNALASAMVNPVESPASVP